MTDHETVDLDALRQALKAWNDGETLYGEGSEALLQAASVVIENAAREFLRLMETAETIQWCGVHKMSGQSWCDIGWERNEGKSCRMVEATLTIREPS